MATVRLMQRSKKSTTIIVDYGIDPITKKRKKETMVVPPEEAEEQRLKILLKLEKGTYKPSSKATLKEYAEYFFTTTTFKKLATKTKKRYKECAYGRIIPWLGSKKIRELSRDDLKSFFQKVIDVGHLDNLKPPKDGEIRKRKEVKRATLEYLHSFISRLLNYAIYEDRILEQNVALKLDLPETKEEAEEDYDPDKGIIKVFTQDEIEKIESKAATEPKAAPYVNLINIALRTGMRREELLGLRWEDINFKERTIFIRQALIHTKEEGYEFKSTKNQKRRIIEITSEVLEALRAEARRQAPFRLRLKDKFQNKKLVFCREDGQPRHPDSVTSWFPSFCISIGVTRLGFHYLRHTHASHLLATKEDISYVSKRLGHSSIQVTYNTYFHLIPLEVRESLKELDKRFKNNK